jgi:adenylate cyclase
VSGGRLQHALVVFLRQEFGASVAAIIGFVEILIEDARRQGLEGYLPDLERMRSAGGQLSTLINRAVDAFGDGQGETATLRHDLRTSLSAIKGYGELLVEEAQDHSHEALQDDLAKVVDLAARLLGEIDRLVEFAAAPAIDVVGNVLRAIKPLDAPDVRDGSAASARILIVDDNAPTAISCRVDLHVRAIG